MKLNTFLHICKREFPEFIEVLEDGGDKDGSDTYNKVLKIILDYKCSFITKIDTLTREEYETLFRIYTLELLREQKDLMYFHVIL